MCFNSVYCENKEPATMEKMMKFLPMRWTFLFAGLMCFAGCTNNAAPPPIVIGHVSDNKRLDNAGEHEEFGIRLALHEATKDGALAETFGGKKIQVNHTKTEGALDAFEAQAVRL